MSTNGTKPLRRTSLQGQLEREVGVAMTAYLHRRLKRGDSRASIAAELGVSPSTVATWGRRFGYGQQAVLEAGWRSGLIQVASYEAGGR